MVEKVLHKYVILYEVSYLFKCMEDTQKSTLVENSTSNFKNTFMNVVLFIVGVVLGFKHVTQKIKCVTNQTKH